MADTRLIATDLDGTLLGSRGDVEFFAALADEMARRRQRGNVRWVVCTGRTLKSFRHTFAPLEMMDIAPDYVIAEHAYIFELSGGRYTPHRLWNWRIHYAAWRDVRQASAAIRRWQGAMLHRGRGVRRVTREGSRLSVRCDTEKTATAITELLKERLCCEAKHLVVSQFGTETEVRTVPFMKGLAVTELARHLGIAREHVLAIGDGDNDMSMLAVEVAGRVGCPANSAPEILRHVHRRGGHIASAPSLEGVIEILRAFENGSVSSSLPSEWVDPVNGVNPRASRSHHHPHRPSRRRGFRRRAAVFVVGIYVVLLVFASFELLPLSGWLMKPFRLAERLIHKVLAVGQR